MSYPPYGAPGGAYPSQPGYPQQPGYPPQQGYPPPQQGYPPQPGYPAQPGFGQMGMPDLYGNPQNIGFQQPQQYPQSSGGMPGGYPPQPAGPGYPGYSYPPAAGGAGSYPPAAGGAGSYPPAAGGAYPPGGGGGAYPQPGGGAYPPAGSYQGMPPGGGASYSSTPVPAPASYPGTYNQIKESGTVRPTPTFNAEEDAKILRKAMKGLGTDEKAIIDLLTARSNAQRQDIKNRFKTMYGKDLIKDLKSELSGHFEQVIVALMATAVEYDAEQLREAMKGAGTNESTLIEILCTRTNRQLQEVKSAYKLKFSHDLEKDLASETSGHFKRLVVSLSTGNRMENQAVDIEKAKRDAMELYQAGERILGTDESKFNQILCSQSFDQLRLVFQEYRKIASRGIDESIKREMSGNLEQGMLAIATVVESKHRFFAEKLYHSMKGAGTKDDALVRVIVSRCEVDMVQIKQEFQRLYGRPLESFIESDTSGDYKKVLLALVRGF